MDIAITGMGLVSALGNDAPGALRAALDGRSGIRRCDERLWGAHGEGIRCRVGATVQGFAPEAVVPARWAASYDPATTYALAAAAEAIVDAGLDWDEALKARTGVVLGCAGPGVQTYHRALHSAFVQGGAGEFPGRMLLQMSGNIYAGLVALRYGLRGPGFGVADACATGCTAIALGADLIRAGRADAAVVGGTEAPIGLTTYGSMINAGAMNPTDDPEGACCPFSADRAGLVMGEGCGVLVLEDAARARARGARIYGLLLGEAMSNDAHHVYSPEPTGRSWANTMSLALERAGVPPEAVDAVSAHAASTPLGDAAETRAIKRALGDRAGQIPVTASKSQVGHALGAAGAIETILALAAMVEGYALPTLGLRRADPECDLDYVAGGARPHAGQTLLKNSFGFGGTNTCLVIRRGDAPRGAILGRA